MDQEVLAGESDEVLMERFCQGEARAFEVLFGRYAQPLHRYLGRLVRDRQQVEDLLQATFLSLVRARGRYRRGARFRPWLYAIATNAARDVLRRRQEQLTPEGELPAMAAEGTDPEDTGLQEAVRGALAQLPESYRLVVVMHRFEGMPFAEIAEVLDTSEGAVRARAHRGYERLRELLRGVWEEMA